MRSMRVVTPDTSLWKYVTKLFDTLGGFQAAVLIACVIGLITGGILWALGAGVNSGSLASRGRWAVIGACGCAVAAAAIPKLVPLVISTFS